MWKRFVFCLEFIYVVVNGERYQISEMEICMNKIFKVIIVIMSTVMLLSACSGSPLEFEEDVQINIEHSSLYENFEIKSAIDIVIDYFDANFEGCTLTNISYEEELCMKEKDEWAYQYEEEDIIILTSTFDVDENGGDGSFDPNSTYSNWLWILTRSDSDEEWTLQTWGY